MQIKKCFGVSSSWLGGFLQPLHSGQSLFQARGTWCASFLLSCLGSGCIQWLYCLMCWYYLLGPELSRILPQILQVNFSISCEDSVAMGLHVWEFCLKCSVYTGWTFFPFQTLLISFLRSILLYQLMPDTTRAVTIMIRLRSLRCMCKYYNFAQRNRTKYWLLPSHDFCYQHSYWAWELW